MRLVAIQPSEYVPFPWKNGRGVTTDIAAAYAPGAAAGEWAAMRWRLGFTSIDAPGPFSAMAGFERHQVVVRGRGLVLRLPDGSEIDERAAFAPVSFAGEAAIESILEAGPVGVVNLIVRRDCARGRLTVAEPGRPVRLGSGVDYFHAADGDAELEVDGERVLVPAGHALRIESARELGTLLGRGIVATVVPHADQAGSAGADR